jgi:hypothetical protein
MPVTAKVVTKTFLLATRPDEDGSESMAEARTSGYLYLYNLLFLLHGIW